MSLPSSSSPEELGCLKSISFSLSYSSPAIRWIYSFLNSEYWKWDYGVWFSFFKKKFSCWVFKQPHVPFPGSFFIYLLELEQMGGRALYVSMLCFLMRFHSKALMPFGQVSFCTFVVLNIFFSHLLFVFFPLSLLLASFSLPLPFSDYPSRFS